MSRTKTTFARRALASVGAAALGLMGVVGLSTSAFAAQGNDGTPPGNAAEGTTGTLTIHKRVNTPGAAGNGTEMNPAPGIPLGGVTFNVQRVGVSVVEEGGGFTCSAIDLTTEAGWAAVEGTPPQGADPAAPVATPTEVDQLCTVESSISHVTDNTTGIAIADGLDLGLYYVTESPKDGVDIAAPFYVTVPYNSVTKVDGKDVTTWLYNVHVYPKNQIAGEPSKTLDSVAGVVVGDSGTVASWTLTSPVLGSPKLPASSTEVTVTDKLGSCLAYVADSGKLKVKVPGLVDVESNITPTFATGSNDAVFTHPFPEGGYPAGTTFIIKYNTTVTCVGDNDGSTWNDSTWGKDVSWWGELEVTKRDKTDNNKLLNGAEFAVYEGVCPNLETGLGAAVASGVTTNGKWTPAGLYVGKGGTEAPTVGASYCLVETKAPNGYVQPTWPGKAQTVSIFAGKVTSATTGNHVAVDNTPVNGPNLPLTGASGTMLMTMGGIGLVAVAGGLYLATRRKAHQE